MSYVIAQLIRNVVGFVNFTSNELDLKSAIWILIRFLFSTNSRFDMKSFSNCNKDSFFQISCKTEGSSKRESLHFTKPPTNLLLVNDWKIKETVSNFNQYFCENFLSKEYVLFCLQLSDFWMVLCKIILIFIHKAYFNNSSSEFHRQPNYCRHENFDQ